MMMMTLFQNVHLWLLEKKLDWNQLNLSQCEYKCHPNVYDYRLNGNQCVCSKMAFIFTSNITSYYLTFKKKTEQNDWFFQIPTIWQWLKIVQWKKIWQTHISLTWFYSSYSSRSIYKYRHRESIIRKFIQQKINIIKS